MQKLAIVIPYYKVDFFEETLMSIAAQTNKNFTLYIGNDASKNNPILLIKKYFDDDEYQYFEYADNLGAKNLALQWERILGNVKEKWFQILGDDDTIAENYVEESYTLFQKASSESIRVLRVNRFAVNSNNELIKEDRLNEGLLLSTDLFEFGYYGKTTTSLSEFIFRLSDYHKYKFDKIPLAWGTDVLAFLKFSNFKNILSTNQTYVKVKVTSKSITGNSSDLLKIKADAYNFFREIILNHHSQHFTILFINKIVRDYFEYCWLNYENPKLNFFSIYLAKGEVIEFLKKNIATAKIKYRNKKLTDGR